MVGDIMYIYADAIVDAFQLIAVDVVRTAGKIKIFSLFGPFCAFVEGNCRWFQLNLPMYISSMNFSSFFDVHYKKIWGGEGFHYDTTLYWSI